MTLLVEVVEAMLVATEMALAAAAADSVEAQVEVAEVDVGRSSLP
jgi:hypothetical protein